jgi:N-acetyl-anhydromuramyl-L-alanine amidase AmpD
MDDGTIYQVNYLTTKSFHAGALGDDAPSDENVWSVGVALMGNFMRIPPSEAQQNAARWLVAYLKGLLEVTDVRGHGSMPGASTKCPGDTEDDWLPYVAGG